MAYPFRPLKKKRLVKVKRCKSVSKKNKNTLNQDENHRPKPRTLEGGIRD